MMILLFSLALLTSVAALTNDGDPLSDYPHVVISNGLVETSVFIPDPEKGFYRSTRFDWSGMIWQLTYKGHTYFVPRNLSHDPLNNEHGMSLAEEFSIGSNRHIPQGYIEAKPGDTFVKIGCGVLRKPADRPEYFFAYPYEMAHTGKWRVSHGKNWIEFRHKLQDGRGFGYEYTKRMELVRGRPELVIRSSLKNTGSQHILQDHYNHNFFGIDSDSIGPNYRVEFAFEPSPKDGRLPPEGRASLEGNQLIYHQIARPPFLVKCQGFGDDPANGTVRLTNTRTGAGVEIGGDFPLYGLNFWTSPITLCPELFVKIDVAPGKAQQWTRTYRFFAD